MPKDDDDESMTALKQEIAAMHKPDFLLMGVVKAGTTSLYHYMNHHPQITGVEAKHLLPKTVRGNITNVLKVRRKNKKKRKDQNQQKQDGNQEEKYQEQRVMDLYPNQDPLMEENMKWINHDPKR